MNPVSLLFLGLGVIVLVSVINAVWQAERRHGGPETGNCEKPGRENGKRVAAPAMASAYHPITEPALSHPLAKASHGDLCPSHEAASPIAQTGLSRDEPPGRYVAFVQYTELTIIRRRA